MIKNKRGDVPITILVLGTFVICSLALLSFFVSNLTISNSFENIDLMEKMNSKINEYNFYKNQRLTDENIKEILKEEDFFMENDYFLINKTDESLFDDDEFEFSIKFFRD